MAQDTVLRMIEDEFKLWGVRYQTRVAGSGHIEMAWQVSNDKPVRKTYLPNTGSDYRGWLNKRRDVRQLFEQDGLVHPSKRAPEPVLKKAMSLPKEQPQRQDHVAAMRGELADLTAYVVELGGIVADLTRLVQGMKAQAPQPAEPPIMPPPPPPPKRAPNTRSFKVITYLSNNWNSFDAIVRDIGLPEAVVKRKLVYLAGKGQVELSDGRWRKTPPAKKPAPLKGRKVPAAIISARKSGRGLNGHRH